MKSKIHAMKKTAILLLLALLGSTAAAQQDPNYVLGYDSGPGFRLPDLLESAKMSFRDRFDLNGDGISDMVLRRVDDEGNPVEMVVVDLAAGGVEILTLSFEDITRSVGLGVVRLVGFFNMNGDSGKEVVFRSREKLAIFTVDLAGGKHSADDPFVLPARRAAVLDLDGDGLLEVIIQNSETQSVQVWGSSGASTATEDDIARAMHRLFQNYPNPFREATTIGYEVEQAGPVTITIYDILGRAIRTLVDQHQPIGTYHIAWDGRDAGGRAVASGTYFYRLRVRETVSSKQAFRVK